MEEFRGKCVIVTGAARGMGAVYCEHLAGLGANVVLADINAEGAAEVASRIQSKGGTALVVQTDVGDPESCRNVAAKAAEAFGGIDYLVNNAGLLTSAKMGLLDLGYQDYLKVTAVQADSVLLMTQAVTPFMKERGKGAIVNTSSIGAWWAIGVYSVNKAAVNSLTTNLNRELLPLGIRMNAVAPGVIETEGSLGNRTRDNLIEMTTAMGKPTKRIGLPEDVVRVGIFLLSDASSFVAGQIIAVDEGLSTRI